MWPAKQVILGHLPFLVRSGHFAIIDKEVAICHLAIKHYSLLYFFYKYITETLYSNPYRVKNHKCKKKLLVKEVGI